MNQRWADALLCGGLSDPFDRMDLQTAEKKKKRAWQKEALAKKEAEGASVAGMPADSRNSAYLMAGMPADSGNHRVCGCRGHSDRTGPAVCR